MSSSIARRRASSHRRGVPYRSGRESDGLTQPMTLMFTMQDTGKPVEKILPEGCYYYEEVSDLPQGRRLYWKRATTACCSLTCRASRRTEPIWSKSITRRPKRLSRCSRLRIICRERASRHTPSHTSLRRQVLGRPIKSKGCTR